MSKFGMTEEQYTWIKKILRTFLPNATVYIFGSRARGDHKTYSDLDLAIESAATIPEKIWAAVQEQFSESSIPFKIDLIDMNEIDPAFKKSLVDEIQVF